MESATRRELGIGLAVTAWLFVLTSLWLPWWLVRYSDNLGNRYDAIGVWLWRPTEEVTTAWGPWVTGMIVAVLGVWLFVRVAGRSWHHEPTVWRRDLGVLAGVAGAALASTLLWPDPDNFTSFWGGTTYTNTTTGTSFTETVLPGLGWWCTALAFLLLAGAYVSTPDDASGK